MSTINLNVDLSELDDTQRNALANFVTSFNKGMPLTAEVKAPTSNEVMLFNALSPEEQPVEEKKKRAPRGSKVQAGAMEGQERTESEVDNYEAANKLEVVTEQDDDIMGEGKTVQLSFDDLREITSNKTQADRANLDKLRGKLKELGVEKLIDLKDKTDKYQDFYDYANSL